MTVSISTNIDMGTGIITGLPASSGNGSATTYGDLKALQTISSSSTFNVSTTSTTYVTTGLSVTITPTSSSNKILILASGVLTSVTPTPNAGGNTDRFAKVTIFRAGSDISASGRGFAHICNDNSSTGANVVGAMGIMYIDAPATTSATTYDLRIKVADISAFTANPITGIFGGHSPNNVCTLIVMEVVA